jgi:hypothetical protein
MAWKVLPVDIQKIPKRAAGAIVRVNAALTLYAFDAQSLISNYPEQQTAYIRTGELGRAWTIAGPKVRGQDIFVLVGNKKPYAGKVQGRDQEELFKGFGWPNITDTNKKVWARHRPLLAAAIKG